MDRQINASHTKKQFSVFLFKLPILQTTALCKQILSLRSAKSHQVQNYRCSTTQPNPTISLSPSSSEKSQNRSMSCCSAELTLSRVHPCGRPACVCAVDQVSVLIGWDPILVVQCLHFLWSGQSSSIDRPINHIHMQQHEHNQLVLGLIITKRGRKEIIVGSKRQYLFCGQLDLYVN